MAFVAPTALPARSGQPVLRISPKRPSSTRTPVATATGPKRPADFTEPKPRRAFIRPDKLGDIASLTTGQLLRLGAGALIEGYRLRNEDGKVKEYSSSLPESRPTLPLQLFEFEACPFCRKVREALTILDLDVVIFPCPKGGAVYREFVRARGGKAMFPYLMDPNTDFAGYESDDIIKYLYQTYGPSEARVSPVLKTGVVGGGLAAALRPGRGRARMDKCVPARLPIELWGYEASPFVKIVRERLTELEIAHLLHSTPRGSPTRAILKERVGRFQVPYIEDPNTGVKMFESAEIAEYLVATYGPDAPGAIADPTEADVYMPGEPMDSEETTATEMSLDPQQEEDKALEEYCDDNPEADECKVYDE